MNEKLQSSNSTFEKIILTEDEYKEASINSREIFVDGKLYDVKSTIVSEGKIELSVIQDVEEKNILDRISSFLKGSGSPEGNISFQLQKLVSLIYLSALPDYHFYIPYARFNLFLPATLSCDSKDLEIYSPPPELV